MSYIRNKLQKINNRTKSQLTKYVINYLLEQGNSAEIVSHIFDILKEDSIPDSFDNAIYYQNPPIFFNKYNNDIEALLLKYEKQTNIEFIIKKNRINFLAWFGFVKTVFDIGVELSLFEENTLIFNSFFFGNYKKLKS